VTAPLTYHGHPLSYWYAEYRDSCRMRDRTPLPLAEWVHDPAHSPQFREAFGLSIRTPSDIIH
jgi:diadenosine tetraphosphatase ApaH/serine/threonine PP2A family protein phosphatase